MFSKSGVLLDYSQQGSGKHSAQEKMKNSFINILLGKPRITKPLGGGEVCINGKMIMINCIL